MKKKQEIQDRSEQELKTLYRDLSKDIFRLKNELALSRKLEKPHELRNKKRDRARALTFLRQKSGNLSSL
jgi:large subunit ribosomal protein L29